jgi:hypothetical protein
MGIPMMVTAQQKAKPTVAITAEFAPETFSELKLGSIGPAVTSGRISDFAVNPKNSCEYYAGTSSHGVWKTMLVRNSQRPFLI